MSAATPDSAAAAKRPIDPSHADPSPAAKLQRSSPPDPSPPAAKLQRSSPPDPSPPAEAQGDTTYGGGEVAGVRSGEMAGARNPQAQRYLVAVEYVGTRFSGSQQQLNQRTVVGVLEEAFHKFIGQPVSIFCSSRTDTGVHALSNVCHVDVERISKRKPGEMLPPHEPGVVKRAVNHFLQAMKKACSILVGHHDFSSFRATGCQANSPMRTLDELSVTEVFPSMFFPSSMERSEMESLDGHLVYSRTSVVESSGKGSDASSTSEQSRFENGEEFGKRLRHRCFVVTARARSFLYHQVRLMVGLLKSVGTGDLTTEDVERILNLKAVTAAPPMAPACGLYLANVKYDLSV